MTDADLNYICDIDSDAATRVARALDVEAISNPRQLIGRVDAVAIAASTSAHFELASLFLEHGIHVLVEKPMTRTSTEAAELVRLADRNRLKLQVGHIERFNPALIAARERLTNVSFIECHRLAEFKARGVDVDVVLDLMIHDLDVILSLVDAKPAIVSAVGIPVLTDRADIANARIEFDNGAIANVTASRVSTSPQRRFRVFQASQYVAIDFDRGTVQRVTSDRARIGHDSPFRIDEWNLEKGDALKAEARAFIDSIIHDTECQVTGRDGQLALELAEMIVADIERRWR